MNTPRLARAATTGAVTPLAIALVATAIHMATPNYAGIRAGRGPNLFPALF